MVLGVGSEPMNAALLNKSDSLGVLAPGYYADLDAVDGDPLADIQAHDAPRGRL